MDKFLESIIQAAKDAGAKDIEVAKISGKDLIFEPEGKPELNVIRLLFKLSMMKMTILFLKWMQD